MNDSKSNKSSYLTSEILHHIDNIFMGAEPLILSRYSWRTRRSWRSLKNIFWIPHKIMKETMGCWTVVVNIYNKIPVMWWRVVCVRTNILLSTYIWCNLLLLQPYLRSLYYFGSNLWSRMHRALPLVLGVQEDPEDQEFQTLLPLNCHLEGEINIIHHVTMLWFISGAC